MVDDNTQTPPGTGEPPTPPGTGEPEVDYKTKFVESQKEALRLKTEHDKLQTELTNLKAQKPQEVTEDEKKVRDILSKVEQEREELTKKEQEELAKELADLHTIYGDTFDDKKLLQIVDRYGVAGEGGKVDWHAAMELYEKLGGEVPVEKPKTPQGKREGANPQPEVETPPDVSKKSMHELVQDGLKKLGIK